MHQRAVRKNWARRTQKQKISKAISVIYKKFRKLQLDVTTARAAKSNNSGNRTENLITHETFAAVSSSIQMQPEELRRHFRGFKEKTPRWQPRGDDTQSFRPLVQEERGVLRVRLLAPGTRVNSLFSLRQPKCG